MGAKKPFLVLKFVPKIIQSGDVRNLLLAKWGANLLGRGADTADRKIVPG